jgi:8-oxo-dGTP pyrophosphatase MutT (NUDIX family)
MPAQYFRCGAGAVITRGDGRVLVLERTGIAGAWQFPQGGLKADETPDQGVLREIQEETGLRPDQLTPIARASRPLAYELPTEMRSRKTGIGQVLVPISSRRRRRRESSERGRVSRRSLGDAL